MSKEKVKKLNKGITLIALIITIVVMLILVGVTLAIALGDNGIINNAKEAKEKTEIATEKEQLLDVVFATVGSSGEVILEDIVLPEGFTEVSSDGNKITYQGPSGKQYEVENVTGKITDVVETEPEGDGDGEDIISVAGTYYSPDSYYTLILNEDGTGTLLGNSITYEYTDSTISIIMGSQTTNSSFEQLEDNKIIIMNGTIMLAMNRNGLEGDEITGQYIKESSSGNFYLTVNSETGEYKIERNNFGSGETTISGEYYYYEGVFYVYNGSTLTLDEDGNLGDYIKQTPQNEDEIMNMVSAE